MRTLLRSVPHRVFAAAAGSALLAAVVVAVNPFPVSVHGQSVPGATVAPAGSTVPSLPATEVSPSVSAPGSAVAPAAAAPVVAPRAQAPVVAQQPVALPRTGTSVAADSGVTTAVLAGLLAVAAASATAAVGLRAHRRRA